MAEGPTQIDRRDWPAVVDAFESFFDGIGRVSTTEAAVEFSADGTGLSLDSDGTSRSFMPLHDLSSTWNRVGFDSAARCVHVWSDTAHYTYRVPPYLIPS
jgi:hypothetical protein